MNKIKNDSQILKDKLFECIENENVCPRSKVFFRCRECVVWTLWLFSILIGSVAVAVSLFVMTHHQYSFYEATHDNLFTLMVEVLPYLWVVIFGLMVYAAMYNMRHTSKGYRYPVWMILVSSLVLSFAGGSALQMFGLGYKIDNILGDHMAMYSSQEKVELRMWQSPDNGRLLGKQTYSTLSPTTTAIFEDYDGKSWQLNIEELQPREIDLLASGERVKLLGKCIGEDIKTFHVCSVFPVMLDKEVSKNDMELQRKMFIDRMVKYARQKEVFSERAPFADFATTSVEKEGVCAQLAAVARMQKR